MRASILRAGTTMHEKRRFARIRPNGLVSKVASIVVDLKKPVIACNVIDLSAGGACLELASQMLVPKRFVLVHGGTRKKCSLVWQAGRRLGVSF
jgi:hypothetical protein